MTLRNSTLVPTVEGEIYLGQFNDTYCFVPDECVVNGQLAYAAYVRSGWATRNARLNLGKTIGSHLFPSNVSDIAAAPKDFLNDLHQEVPRLATRFLNR